MNRNDPLMRSHHAEHNPNSVVRQRAMGNAAPSFNPRASSRQAGSGMLNRSMSGGGNLMRSRSGARGGLMRSMSGAPISGARLVVGGRRPIARGRPSAGVNLNRSMSGGGGLLNRSMSGGGALNRSIGGGGALNRSMSRGGGLMRSMSGGGGMLNRSMSGGGALNRSLGGGMNRSVYGRRGVMNRSLSSGGFNKSFMATRGGLGRSVYGSVMPVPEQNMYSGSSLAKGRALRRRAGREKPGDFSAHHAHHNPNSIVRLRAMNYDSTDLNLGR